MDKVSSTSPSWSADLVSVWAETVRIETTSMTTKVIVEAFRADDPTKKVVVTEAAVVYVNVGPDRKPASIVRKLNESLNARVGNGPPSHRFRIEVPTRR